MCFNAPSFIYKWIFRFLGVRNRNPRAFESITKWELVVPKTFLTFDTNCKFGGFPRISSDLIIHYKNSQNSLQVIMLTVMVCCWERRQTIFNQGSFHCLLPRTRLLTCFLALLPSVAPYDPEQHFSKWSIANYSLGDAVAHSSALKDSQLEVQTCRGSAGKTLV